MRKFLALSSLAAMALAACSAGGGDTIKIGMISALTGDAAAIGADQLSGVQWAIEKINADGGIDGRQLVLVAEDGKCTGADAATAAQKLVNADKVSVIIGGSAVERRLPPLRSSKRVRSCSFLPVPVVRM